MALLSRSFARKGAISLATILSVAATSFALAQDPTSGQHIRAEASDANEQLFLFENDLALSHMSTGMLVKATGDIDRDFVAVMIPHHQGAIDMARAELKYGHNEELRRLAQNIVTQQEQEISAMQDAVGEASPTHVGGAPVSPSTTVSNSANVSMVSDSMKVK
jgi:uncharacterized protein (DUF305 family)